MSSPKELAMYIMEQLSELEEIRNIPMMGGYIFYYRERIFGGIYGSGFMVKITEASKKYMPDSIAEPPYEGAKPMLPVTILDDRELLQKMVCEMFPELPICLHQDHGSSVDVCQSAIVNGYSSVMMDGSLEADGKTPSSFEYNVKVTKEVVARAHAVGASVEGELGVIGSLETGKGDKEDGHGAEGVIDKKRLVTDPDEAARFVAETKLDALAVAVGTSHGAYKFTRKPDGEILAIDVIEKIHAKLPNTHMVMHGSSSVPQELQDLINAYGGAIPQTYGVPVEEIVRGIKSGVRKVNVDTDCRMAITGALRKIFAET